MRAYMVVLALVCLLGGCAYTQNTDFDDALAECMGQRVDCFKRVSGSELTQGVTTYTDTGSKLDFLYWDYFTTGGMKKCHGRLFFDERGRITGGELTGPDCDATL